MAELDPTAGANGLLFSTALGNNPTYGAGVALDGSGMVYVAGHTGSRSFPTTAGSFQPNADPNTNNGSQDGFVAKLDPTKTAPAVAGLSRGGGPFSGGTTVVISGCAFTGASAVRFGGWTRPASPSTPTPRSPR